MEDLTSGEEPKEKASISFLPIIDLNPNDEHCIYSTLLFIADQAKKFNIVTPCVTFDQPLWLKATGIIADTNMSMVARLGGFHTVMSFLGSIGKLMKGSGLQELSADGSVESMIYGKAVSRALRAQFLVESALMSILLEMVDEYEEADFSSLKTFVKEFEQKNLTINEVNNFRQSPDVIKIENMLQKEMDKLASASRTAKLWLFY